MSLLSSDGTAARLVLRAALLRAGSPGMPCPGESLLVAAKLVHHAAQQPNHLVGDFTDTGTSGVLDFDAPVKDVADDVREAQYLLRSTAV